MSHTVLPRTAGMVPALRGLMQASPKYYRPATRLIRFGGGSDADAARTTLRRRR